MNIRNVIANAARIIAILLFLLSQIGYGQVYNVKDYGAIPNDETGLSLPNAVEAARVDMLAYQRANKDIDSGVKLYIPGGHWYTAYPILFDLDHSHLVGDGQDVTSVESLSSFPSFILGIRRSPNNVSLSNDHYVDLFGKFDWVEGPNQYYGIRTKGDSHVALWSSPFSFTGCDREGKTAYWEGVPQVTINFCMDWNGNKPPNVDSCDIMGMWDSNRPRPWKIAVNGNVCYVDVIFSDNKFRRFSFSFDSTVLDRISIEIDTVKGGFYAWVNKKQVQVNQFGPAFAGLKFIKNDYYPFLIGGLSDNVADAGASNHIDYSILGLQISRGLLYKVKDVGSDQESVDGKAINDRSMFISGENTTIANLLINNNSNRLVRYMSGVGSGYNGFGYGLFFSSNIQINTNFNIPGQHVSNMTFMTRRGSNWGQALTIGGNFGLNIDHCRFIGGFHGLGSLPTGASYPNRFNDLKATGYDSCFHLLGQIANAANLDCDWAGSTAIRCSGSLNLRNIYVNSQSRGESTIKWHTNEGPRKLTIEGLHVDNEGSGFPTKSIIEIENGYYGETRLTIRNVMPGIIGTRNASVVNLIDNPLNAPNESISKAYLSIEDIQTDDKDYKALVTEDGSAWSGTIKRFIRKDDPPIYVGNGNMKVTP